jgi:hypothetical protein
MRKPSGSSARTRSTKAAYFPIGKRWPFGSGMVSLSGKKACTALLRVNNEVFLELELY